MDTARIRSALNEIDKCRSALGWLQQHGRNLLPIDRDAYDVTVRLHHASACHGAAEAAQMLTSFARHSMPDIVQWAIQNCVNTIEISESVIREELAKSRGEPDA